MIKIGAMAGALALAAVVPAGTAEAQQPFLLGAFPGMKIEQFENEIGHTVAVDDNFQTFSELPKVGVYHDIQLGITPMISWGSNVSGNSKTLSVLATDILNGVYDQQLVTQADAIAGLHATILLEWEPEMTDNQRNAQFFAGVPLDQQGPTYVAVWQHIHDLFVSQGATNAQWVWSPGGSAYIPNRHGVIRAQAYFPGASYIDWMGLHGYNKSTTPQAYDADPNVQAFYSAAAAWAPGKPLIHAQTAAISTTDAQREWIATAQTTLKSEFPLIRGFVWFNTPAGKYHYALTGAGLSAFQAMAADSYFQ